MKKRIVIAVALVIVCLAGLTGISCAVSSQEADIADSPEEMVARLEAALGDEYKKQTVTELVATLCYSDGDENKINYHILKTTYYEADPAEVTGLNVAALHIFFDPDYADTCQEMMIQDWPGALYEVGDRSYLCWSYSPEVTYVLEYDPAAVSDEEIIKMAESAEVME